MAQGSTTALRLAEALAITSTAVRRHLDALEIEGLITSRAARTPVVPERGRPAKVFSITDLGRSYFHQAYGDLATQAITQLIEIKGAAALPELAEAHFQPIAKSYYQIKSIQPDLPNGEVLVEALAGSGYAAEINKLRTGWQLCQHHCPVAEVTRLFPELCEAETRLISSLLGSHAQRLATIAHGDGVCTTSLPGIHD